MTRLKSLIERRYCKRQWVYIMPAIFLFLVGLMGLMYGAALFYWSLALVCLSLVFYPTLLAWGIITSIYLIGSVIYIFAMIKDLIVPSKAGIYSDGIIGPLFVLIIIGLSSFVVASFPKKTEQESEPRH